MKLSYMIRIMTFGILGNKSPLHEILAIGRLAQHEPPAAARAWGGLEGPMLHPRVPPHELVPQLPGPCAQLLMAKLFDFCAQPEPTSPQNSFGVAFEPPNCPEHMRVCVAAHWLMFARWM